MVKYVFRDPLILKGAADANPQVIGKELERAKNKDGEIEPKSVVDLARPDTSPIHRHFEWDNDKAAEAHRLDQARILIRSVRLEDDNLPDGETAPAFVSISDYGGTRYHPMGDVKKSEALSTLILQSALRDLEAFQKRYRQLQEVCTAVSRAKSIVQRKLARKESRQAGKAA